MSCIYLAVVIIAFSTTSFAGPLIVRVGPPRGVVVAPLQQLSYKPYEFGYELGDGRGMIQHRREVADGSGAVRGSYGYLDPAGVTRVVRYQADDGGYRAVINSNEPGLTSQSVADAIYIVKPPPSSVIAQGLRRVAY